MAEMNQIDVNCNRLGAQAPSRRKISRLRDWFSGFAARWNRDQMRYRRVLKSYENELPFWLFLQVIRPLMILTTPKCGRLIPPMEGLQKLAPGTLGREVYEFHRSHNFTNVFDVGSRRFQLHDCLHVIMGYETDPAGEAEFHAFILGTKGLIANHPGILYYTTRSWVWRRIWKAFKRGRNSTLDPDRWRIEQEWNVPVLELRRRYNM